ncbi:hypothetical protein JQ298_07555 [Helicobacter pylori]|uniref:hypothetical protein n=1 Tax=Helicobacter pylori TaxID=210 RepID=UPI00193452C3|nr:hypothetical protein [Helicobacter pylori]MBM0609190.1 hypothetical protein [Helicobacter pylori]
MSGCKMSRVSRELLDNIKSFLHYKLKTMIRIQSVNELPKTNALKPLAFSYGDTRRNAFRR